jgi:hypothetical protein
VNWGRPPRARPEIAGWFNGRKTNRDRALKLIRISAVE